MLVIITFWKKPVNLLNKIHIWCFFFWHRQTNLQLVVCWAHKTFVYWYNYLRTRYKQKYFFKLLIRSINTIIVIIGCSREVQNSWNHSVTHQVACDRRQQDQDARARSAECSQSAGPLFHEDRPHWGRHANPLRQHSQEGRTSWQEIVI